MLFLLFREPNPKHTVIESEKVVIALLCLFPTLTVGLSVSLAIAAFACSGVYAVALSLLAYILPPLATLEVLHILYDR
ncbi:MAG: hypothetical protein QXJ31_05195 [Candidatus Bathyarchaeia archaeon]